MAAHPLAAMRSRRWQRFATACVTLCLFVLSAPTARPADAVDVWEFDRAHTEVRFSWNHLGLARQSGEFTEVQGAIEFTPTAPEEGKVTANIRVSSLWTGVKDLDDLLRSADFFAAARHPAITFTSTAVRRTGDKSGEIDGELTLLGVTKPVTLATIWNFTGEHPLGAINPLYAGKWVSGFSARTTIRRSEFGLSRAVPLVSDEIEIEIQLEAIRKP